MVLSDNELSDILLDRFDVYDIIEELDLSLAEILQYLISDPDINGKLRDFIERS